MAICSESPSLTTCRPPTDPPLKTMDVHSFRPNKHRYCIIFALGGRWEGCGREQKKGVEKWNSITRCRK